MPERFALTHFWMICRGWPAAADLDRAAAGLGAAQLRDVQHRFEQRADAGRDRG